MSTGTELVIPYSGELIALDNPEQCASAYYEIRELEARIRELKGALVEAIFNESVRVGSKTLHFPGGMTAKITTPADIHWDYDILLELLEAGLPGDRFEALVMTEVSIKVNGSVAKELQGANPVYAEIIEKAKTRVPRTPSVAVSPAKRV